MVELGHWIDPACLTFSPSLLSVCLLWLPAGKVVLRRAQAIIPDYGHECGMEWNGIPKPS